jgi:hypothetical protein
MAVACGLHTCHVAGHARQHTPDKQVDGRKHTAAAHGRLTDGVKEHQDEVHMFSHPLQDTCAHAANMFQM